MDQIANFIISLKNGGMAGKESVVLPYSNIKFQIANLLREKGFVKEVAKKGKKNRYMEVTLRYENKSPFINDVKRISKSSRRVYMQAKEIYPYRQGVGMTVFSTPNGILSDKDAKKSKVGGEALFSIW